MNHNQNIELLRPFDLDAAKAGDLICCGIPADGVAEFVGMADGDIRIVLRWMTSNELETYCVSRLNEGGYHLRMQPLGWFEGRPVYKGDVMYRPSISGNTPLVVDTIFRSTPNGEALLHFTEGACYALDNRYGFMTWEKPKTTKYGWVNIYNTTGPQNLYVGHKIYCTEDIAKAEAGEDLVSTAKIEWEE